MRRRITRADFNSQEASVMDPAQEKRNEQRAPHERAERDAHGHEVWRLTAGEAESALQQAGSWSARGRDSHSWFESASKLDRQRVTGALARAAVTKALGGYAPPWIVVRGSEIPGCQVVIREGDNDAFAAVCVEVAIAHPIENTALKLIGWAWCSERHHGEWRGDWPSPAHVMPHSAERGIAELRAEVKEAVDL